MTCRPLYLYKADVEGGDTNDLAWQCRSLGWRLPFDDLSLPFWNWKSIEKFWVDANFWHGSIPVEIGEKWPHLRTLDLYNNDMSGPLPSSLRQLRNLSNIQLQDNNFSGVIPADLWQLPLLGTVHL